MYFTSGTSGEPKMVAHNYLYPLGHITTGVFWHNLHENSIHLTVADTRLGKQFGANYTANGLQVQLYLCLITINLQQKRFSKRLKNTA